MTKSLPKLPALPKSRKSVRCECGCDGLTQSRFVPGHDSRLKGMRIRVERNLWDDSPEAIDDTTAQLDALAAAMSEGEAAAVARELRWEWQPKSVREAKTA